MGAQDDFEDLVRHDLAPFLRDRGFKRTRATFRRRADGAWQVVNLQKDKWSSRYVVGFTVNLGVALDDLAEDPPAWHARGWPLEYECHLRHRLAGLSGGPVWESLGRWRDRKGRTARRVIGDLATHGLPWLDLYADPQRLLASLVDAPASLEGLDVHAVVPLAEARGTTAEQRAARDALALAIERAVAEERG